MKVFIITEGGKDIGFGHITRCLSLYQAFEEREIKPKFIVNRDNNNEYLLNGANYQLLNWIEKPDKVFELLKGADIAIIDSYLADSSFYIQVSNLVKTPVYIDDNKRLDYPDGVVLNGNIHAETLNYPKKDGIIYLLGTKYTHLRKEFWEVPEKKIKEKIESIMVTFGGNDAKNMTPKILAFLNDKYQNLIKNVIIGRAFQNIDEIKKYTDKNTNLIYYPDAEKMREIMFESDIAISVGGQTICELIRMGIPFIPIQVLENQKYTLKGLKKYDLFDFILYWDMKDFNEELTRGITNLFKATKRKLIFKKYKRFIDGLGSKRIIYEFLKG